MRSIQRRQGTPGAELQRTWKITRTVVKLVRQDLDTIQNSVGSRESAGPEMPALGGRLKEHTQYISIYVCKYVCVHRCPLHPCSWAP